MRDVQKNEELLIPEGVTVAIKSRVVVVEGPRGKLEKSIKHINMDLRLVSPKAEGRQSKVTLVVWHGARKHVACLRTVKSMIQNMITGVTKGFRYKLKAVYAHFPVNIIINDGGKSVEIRNFLGEKVRYLQTCPERCKASIRLGRVLHRAEGCGRVAAALEVKASARDGLRRTADHGSLEADQRRLSHAALGQRSLCSRSAQC